MGQDLSALNIFLANIPFEGRLASVNATASGGSAAGGNGSGDGEAGGEDGEDGGNGTAAGVAESEGAAGHVTVLSSVGLVLVGVSSLMALL